MKVEITKRMTVNTGNYSSAQPSITLSKDIADENVEKGAEALATLCEILMIKNLVDLIDLQESIKLDGPKAFIEELNAELLKEEMKRCIDELKVL